MTTKTKCGQCDRLQRISSDALTRYMKFYDEGGLDTDEKQCRQLHTEWLAAMRALDAHEQDAEHTP